MSLLSTIANQIKRSPRCYDALNRLRPVDGPLELYLSTLPSDLTFMQIGASDGLRWDPLRRFVVGNRWHGVFVEPLPYAFDLLKKNYLYLVNVRGVNLTFVNVAVTGEASAPITLWTFSDEFLKTLSVEERMYYLRKASFERDNVAQFVPASANADRLLKKQQVATISINDLIHQHFPGDSPDLLMIDAEGYDHIIVKNIDFSRHRPRYIIFEAHSFTDDEIWSTLRTNGFTIKELGGDVAAILTVE